jgi:chloramphenicol-sensitive protein RarD
MSTQPGGPAGRPSTDPRDQAIGLASATGAFLLWGLVPIYFKAVEAAGAAEILAHRVVWSVPLLAALAFLLGRWPVLTAALANPRLLRIYALTTLLIATNWLVFIWAVTSDHILQASLGYFINPLVSVALGAIFLGERLNRWQMLAVALAIAGVGNQLIGLGTVPYASLALAFSFGFYSLVRKKAATDSITGLLIEVSLLMPLGLAFMLWLAATGEGLFAVSGWWFSLLLVASGLVTAAPLVLFLEGAKRLTLATIGILQYLGPSLHFVLAVFVFDEPFTTTHLLTFAAIWAALAVYSGDALAQYRRARRGEEAIAPVEPVAQSAKELR